MSKCDFFDDSPIFTFMLRFVVTWVFLAIILVGVVEPLLKYATDGQVTLKKEICNCCKIHEIKSNDVITLVPN